VRRLGASIRQRMQGSKPRLPAIGDVVGGKYRVSRFLGIGGMGKVMAAEHVLLGSRFALKFMHPALMGNPVAVQRFAREARASARLRSENTVRIVDVDTLPWGGPYLVMEYLEGYSLERIVFAKVQTLPKYVVRWGVQACRALAEAHAVGIVHRDIKPENLFLATPRDGGEATLKVLDFGLAKCLDETSGSTSSKTTVGSPQYMSPEQVMGRQIDHRADIWSLGATLYELLCGHPPFHGGEVHELFDRILREPAPPLALQPRGRDLPPALVHVIMRCLERNPNARWQSTAELAYVLEQAGAPVPVHPAGVRLSTPSELPPPVTVSNRHSVPPPCSVSSPAPAVNGLVLAAAATLCGLALTGMAAGILAHRFLPAAARPSAEAASLPSPAASGSAKLPARFPGE
jgi:eukaryotic-like serine/threonine-protein kinase